MFYKHGRFASDRYLINKIKKIKDFDYSKTSYVRLFVTTFVEAVFLNKDKKIAVVVNIDNSLFIPPSNYMVHSLMVELMGSDTH